MRSKLLHGETAKTWALVFDPGDEPVSLLTGFAAAHKIHGGRISGIGGFSSVTLAYFDIEKKQYLPIPIDEQVEVVSLLGNLSLYEGKPKLHLHCVIGKRDGGAHGGHLLEARVRPTLELMLVESETSLQRRLDPATDLPLLDL